MNLDSTLDVFINWQTIILCLSIYLISFIIKTVIETIIPTALTNKYYKAIFVTLSPIFYGVFLGYFAHMFPWPIASITDSAIARCLYGAVCGMSSGWVYSAVRTWVKAKEASLKSPIEELPVVPIPVNPIKV